MSGEMNCPWCGAESDKIIRLIGSNRFECRSQVGVTESQSDLCKMITALRQQLAAVTAERDDFRDTAAAIMTAACGTDDIDEQERMCNAAGTKPSHFIAKQRKQLADLQELIDAAPVGMVVGFHDGCVLDVELDEGESILFSRVRLLAEPEPAQEES